MPKRYLTGGGKRLKNYSKSICYPSNIFRNLKYFTKELAQFLKPRNEEELSRGAILIEFAICMPVLIILLFYIHDLVRVKRYYSQTEFVAQQMANMIQNISQKRENKAVTLQDLKYIHCVAWLSIYPGTTMYKKNNMGYDFAHMPRTVIFYIKGVGNGKVSCLWRAFFSMKETDTPDSVFYGARTDQNDASDWITQLKTDVTPSEINPQLPEIKEGEKRIIIEVGICRRDGKNSSGTIIPLRESLGLYLITPKIRSQSIANSFVIFEPKRDIFTDEPPQDS